MPSFTRKLDLPYGYNNFSIEFASLTYKNPGLNRYAYQLVGFDKDWQYTDANRRFAYYNIKAKELKKIGKNGIVQMDIQLSPGNYSIAFNQDVLGSMLTGSMSLINNMFGK